MAMVVFPGLPFELDDNGARNARPHRFNSLTQMIGDDNVTIHSNFIHGDVEPQLVTEGRFLTKILARDVPQIRAQGVRRHGQGQHVGAVYHRASAHPVRRHVQQAEAALV